MNPILPIKHFVPDGEARVMPDGRLYLYGSYDISGEAAYGSSRLHVFSTDDLLSWTDHGICLESKDIPDAGENNSLYAPDCIYRNGLYYLYICMRDAYEGVAVSNHPYGPFANAVPIKGAHYDSIDPAVLIDDDGQAYYFWGQFHLRGAKLNEDMKSLDLTSLQTNIIDEKQHGFHEGICIRKRNGIYYLVYTDISRGRATCLSYAVSASPLGPYCKGGVIIDNTGCDPESWNNHGSIAEFKGQWYVFYHRSSQCSKFSRRMCIEPIFFDEEGNIREVCMTTQGCSPVLPSAGIISAARACQMCNGIYITPSSDCSFEVLTHGTNGCWAAYRYFNFQNPRSITITAAAAVNGGTVEIWADNRMIGTCLITPTDGFLDWQPFTCGLEPTVGIKTLYLVLKGNDSNQRLMDLKEFEFFS